MVTERVRTLPTEPTEGKIVKSNPLLSFINIGQRGRTRNIHSKDKCRRSNFENSYPILYAVCLLHYKPTALAVQHNSVIIKATYIWALNIVSLCLTQHVLFLQNILVLLYSSSWN